jgi:hypothetical protein
MFGLFKRSNSKIEVEGSADEIRQLQEHLLAQGKEQGLDRKFETDLVETKPLSNSRGGVDPATLAMIVSVAGGVASSATYDMMKALVKLGIRQLRLSVRIKS